ncbi:class II aldolase/adducin family protein [Streptomyces sp. NPDC050523]|uniref:class II aldolase/adducin family protein n=1 Tax=Streptomyces sp. NPDC050523 TaxID=3365622 RepID=UPI00379123EE
MTSATNPASAPAEPPLPELFQRPPVFADPAAERQHRKERLTATLRLFGRFGYEEGLAGHITVVDPVQPGTYWANPMGLPFQHITVDDLVLVDEKGTLVEGERPVNLGAFNIHVQLHLARPEVVCVVHTHSIHGRAFSALGIPLAPITQDACPFFEDHAVFADYTGIVLDDSDGRRIAAILGAGKAVILRNHGLITVAGTVDAAAWWFIAMDRCCHAQLLAQGAGPLCCIPDEVARLTRAQIGNDLVGWNSFQPLFQWIARSEPDLFGSRHAHR